jgi:hypothetical protein
VLISAKKDGRVVAFYFTSNHESNVSITEAAKEMVASLSAQGYVVSTVHNQPSGTEPSSADYEMAAQFSGGKHFIVSNDKAVEFSSGKAIERGLSSVARSFRSFSFNHEGSDDAALRKIAHEGFQKFLAVVEAAVETQNTDKLTHRFVCRSSTNQWCNNNR